MSEITYETTIKCHGKTRDEAVQALLDEVDALGGSFPQNLSVSQKAPSFNYTSLTYPYDDSVCPGGYTASCLTKIVAVVDLPDSLQPF